MHKRPVGIQAEDLKRTKYQLPTAVQPLKFKGEIDIEEIKLFELKKILPLQTTGMSFIDGGPGSSHGLFTPFWLMLCGIPHVLCQ